MTDLAHRYSCEEHGTDKHEDCIACEVYGDIAGLVERIAELEESDESMKEILRRNIATTEKAEAERDRALRRSEKYCLDLGEKETTVTELRAEVELTKGISDGFSVALMEAEAKLKAVEDAIIAFRREAVDAAAIDGETWLPSKTSGAMARMLAIITQEAP